jgi:hypothetical protein
MFLISQMADKGTHIAVELICDRILDLSEFLDDFIRHLCSDCQNFLYDWRGPHPVIPAEAGIQKSFLGSRFRGNDGRYSIPAKQAESVRCENQTAHLVAKRT